MPGINAKTGAVAWRGIFPKRSRCFGTGFETVFDRSRRTIGPRSEARPAMRSLSASESAMAWLAGTVVTSQPRSTSSLTGSTATQAASVRQGKG